MMVGMRVVITMRVLMCVIMTVRMLVRVRVRMLVVVVVMVVARARLVGCRVRVRMSVGMTVRMPSARAMSSPVPMVVMPKRSHTNQVYNQAQAAHNEQLCQSLGFPTLQDSFESLDHDLDADEPIVYD